MKKKKNPLKRTRKISEPNLVLFNPWKFNPTDDRGPHCDFPQEAMTVKQWKNCDNLLCEALFDAESDEDMKDWKLFCAAKGEFVHVCRMRIREGKIESEVWIETLGSGEDECWISLNEYDENFNEPGHWMRPSETQSPILGE